MEGAFYALQTVRQKKNMVLSLTGIVLSQVHPLSAASLGFALHPSQVVLYRLLTPALQAVPGVQVDPARKDSEKQSEIEHVQQLMKVKQTRRMLPPL